MLFRSVEGATLISGGNIVLKRGMQGADRGTLEAEGNITAKFLENSKVVCKGSLRSDAILHSQVSCQEKIEVLGKKGQINGGSVKTYADISVTNLGSTMGAATKIEIISEKELIVRTNDLKEEITEAEKALQKIEQIVHKVKEKLAKKQEITPEQKKYLKSATIEKPELVKQIREKKEERERLLRRIEKNKKACIRVDNVVYQGVEIVVKDVKKIQHESVSHCRFVRDGADVKMVGL